MSIELRKSRMCAHRQDLPKSSLLGDSMLMTTRASDFQMSAESTWSQTCAGTWIGQPAPADMHTLHQLLATFEPITLAQLSDAALLDRFEIKYVLPQRLLIPVLAELRGVYRVLIADSGRPSGRYRTLYFDTADMALYHRHHAGAQNRYKVRAREYVDSRIAFLEVKHKIGRRRAVKNRILTDDLVTTLTPQVADFLAATCPYAADSLAACLWNHYTRITLVSKQRAERVTLDLNLAFVRETEYANLPGIVVAEIKYQGLRCMSEFARLMHSYHVRDTSFSKYCIGVSLLYPNIKHNKFKARLRQVARLAQGVYNEPH